MSADTIPQEDIERLFLPFKRRENRSGGLGLGLFISSEIAREHGPMIELQSDAVETRFTLTLPFIGQ